ncbi:hypothetical protein ACVV7K_003806 [Cronobacter sakazakii]
MIIDGDYQEVVSKKEINSYNRYIAMHYTVLFLAGVFIFQMAFTTPLYFVCSLLIGFNMIFKTSAGALYRRTGEAPRAVFKSWENFFPAFASYNEVNGIIDSECEKITPKELSNKLKK